MILVNEKVQIQLKDISVRLKQPTGYLEYLIFF